MASIVHEGMQPEWHTVVMLSTKNMMYVGLAVAISMLVIYIMCSSVYHLLRSKYRNYFRHVLLSGVRNVSTSTGQSSLRPIRSRLSGIRT